VIRAVLLILGLHVGLTAGPVAGAPARAPKADGLKAKQEALGEVQKHLDDAKARASAARSREVSLLAEVEEMDRTVARKRGELRRLDRRIVRLEAELAALEGQRGRVAEDTLALRGALAARLRALDRLRRAPAAPGRLGEATDVRRARAAEDLGRVLKLDLGQLIDFDETAERLVTRREAVTRGRRELVELRRAVDTERAAINEQMARRRALLTEVRDDRATNERMVAELGEAARRLEQLVQELARRAQARARTRAVAARPRDPGRPSAPGPADGGAAVRPPAVGLGALRGQLPWPIDGRIMEGFGRQVHPRFGTETFRHGVEIEGAEGALIRAVYGGTVLYRGWLKGYGNLVILDHGAGYYTLYGHASDLLVDEGDSVRVGQGIARVGDTGSLAGPRLYFEVRYQGRPEDPREWLKRRL
jgi:murein hydrolase activator